MEEGGNGDWIIVEDEEVVFWALMKVFHKLNEMIPREMNILGENMRKVIGFFG